MANTYNLQLSSAASQYALVGGSVFNSATPITIECYIKATSLGGTAVLVSKWDGGSGNMYNFRLNASNIPELLISTNGSDQNTYTATSSLTVDVCYHLAAVFNAAGNVSIYINSVLNKSQGSVSSIASNSSAIRIGCAGNNPGVTDFYNGTIDDVRIWNVARTAADILDNYQRELAGNESGLLGYWKLDNSYSDSTSNGNTLTPSGVPSFTTAVCFTDNTTTSTSTTTTSTSSSTTTTSTSTTSTSTSSSSSTSTSRTTSTSTTSTSTTSTITTTSTTTTSTSTTSTSSSTTTTSTSSSTSSSTSTSTTITIDLRLIVERVR